MAAPLLSPMAAVGAAAVCHWAPGLPQCQRGPTLCWGWSCCVPLLGAGAGAGLWELLGGSQCNGSTLDVTSLAVNSQPCFPCQLPAITPMQQFHFQEGFTKLFCLGCFHHPPQTFFRDPQASLQPLHPIPPQPWGCFEDTLTISPSPHAGFNPTLSLLNPCLLPPRGSALPLSGMLCLHSPPTTCMSLLCNPGTAEQRGGVSQSRSPRCLPGSPGLFLPQ